jgi:hypothetical protein
METSVKDKFFVHKGIQPAVKRVQFIGFEVLTAVTMKITLFWDVIQYSLIKVKTFWRNVLHPSWNQRISHISNQEEAGGKQSASLLALLFDPENGDSVLLQNVDELALHHRR